MNVYIILIVPHINQHYIVPHPSSVDLLSDIETFDNTAGNLSDPTKDYRHVSAVYSMWSYFLDFCAIDENSIVIEKRVVEELNPFNLINCHTGNKRLSVFSTLSQGKSLTNEE